MSGNQQIDDSEFDGAGDRFLSPDDQPLTMEYLQAHPVWQYMLKRLEADQIAVSGPPLHEIEMWLGPAPIEYANWIKFDSKGKRIAWSQAIKRPKGDGWQPYTKPKRQPRRGKTVPAGDVPQKDHPQATGPDKPAETQTPALKIEISQPQTLKEPEIEIDGKKAEVGVRINATVKRGQKDLGSGWLAFSVKMKDGTVLPSKVNWLQLAKYNLYGPDGKEVKDQLFVAKTFGGERITLLSGDWNLDTLLPPEKSKPENAFANSYPGIALRTGGELTFIDKPGPADQGPPKKFPTLLFNGDTFLVSGKSLLYRIRWSVTMKWDAQNNEWDYKPKIESDTGPISSLPKGHYLHGTRLYGGDYKDKSGAYLNPLSKDDD